jgi:glycosyltransferase involved in cell wall biosynthesis
MEQRAAASGSSLLTVVVPLYNEQAVIPAFHARLVTVLDRLDVRSEILYVNDGSRDQSMNLLRDLHRRDERVSIVDLSRNFGKEVALTAGLDHARGDAVVVIDCDLQDPPEVIPELLEGWRRGYDVVYGQRELREGESWLKRLSAAWFYRLMQRIGDVPIPRDTGDFRLLSRRAADAVRSLRERHRFMKGLFAWVGYPQLAIPYRREPRYAGHTKWNYWGLWNFAIEGFTSFTIAPLKLATYLGAVVALLSFSYATVIVYKTIAYGETVRGYPSLMVVVLFLGGVQLVSLGLIGEYLGRMFDEAKRRPLYLVSQYLPSQHEEIVRTEIPATAES